MSENTNLHLRRWPFDHAFECKGGAAGWDVVVCMRCGVQGFGNGLWQRLFRRCR